LPVSLWVVMKRLRGRMFLGVSWAIFGCLLVELN
jgi:apolipoprotein N-acyltransferase